MSRFTLAFSCFFQLLFKGKLPAKAAEYLPVTEQPKSLAPAAKAGAERGRLELERRDRDPDGDGRRGHLGGLRAGERHAGRAA